MCASINNDAYILGESAMSIDKVLVDFLRSKSKDLGDKNIIKVTESLHVKKIAFDLFKVDNDPYDGLWVSEVRDGDNYLVRASSPEYTYETSGDWTAVSNYDLDNVTLKYKEAPIIRFSSDEYNFSEGDIMTFKSAVLENTNDKLFVRKVLLEQTEAKRAALLSTFPEFSSYLKE